MDFMEMDDDVKMLEDFFDVLADDCFHGESYPASKFWLSSMVPPLLPDNLPMDSTSKPLGSTGCCKSNENVSLINESTKEVSLLPPCRICGETASGFHYGANTCEACKGFFRRSLRRTSTHRCNNDGNCEISVVTRGQCSSCRYKKCLSIGMSKEAIKTGRYTHEKKSKDLEEVRQMMKRNIIPPSSSSSSPPSSSSSSSLLSADDSYNNNSFLQIIHWIVRTHLHYSKACVPDIHQREEEHLLSHAMEKKVFGSLKTIPLEEYLNIYHTTGMDIDGRKEMLEGFVPLVDHNIRKLMAVAKAVPGFDGLPIEDQIQVIKSSRFEVWMILHHKQFNPEKKLFTTIHGKVVCYEDMIKLHTSDYIEALMSSQERIKHLDLGYEETCILAALTMMFNDRCSLIRPSSVEDMQTLLLKCLIFWLDWNTNDHARASLRNPRFWKMVSVLIQLRTVRHLHDFEEEKLIRLWFDKVHISPLIYEMWAL